MMADDDSHAASSPPGMAAIKEEDLAGSPLHMERTLSMDIREEGRDLKEAAEQSLSVILDLNLDNKIRWVGQKWLDVVGTSPEEVKDKPIEDILIGDNSVFAQATEALRSDDHSSKVIRFSVQMGPRSLLKPAQNDNNKADVEAELDGEKPSNEGMMLINLEAQGIMVYDRATGGESHTMWMIRPAVQREVTIDLPDVLVEALGVGAEILAHNLTVLADGANDPQNNPPPLPVLCRICERQIYPWWFPKHTELCLQEHRAEASLQVAQENLTDHRNAIVKVLDAFEALSRHMSRPSGDHVTYAPVQPDYKGQMIGVVSSPSSSISSGRTSPGAVTPGSGDRPASGLSHHRARSFAVRRPLSRIVELVLDLCDTALEISTPALRDARGLDSNEVRTQSPQSEGRVSQILQWQSPSAGTLEQEAGLSTLCNDTAKLAKEKVEAVLLYQRILEYSERIRNEVTTLVQVCIDAAMHKVARITAGELSSDSGDESPDGVEHIDNQDTTGDPHLQDTYFQASFDGESAMTAALRSAYSCSPLLATSSPRRVSSAISTRSNSPDGCKTPRSRASISIPAQMGTRDRAATISDAGADSDSSVCSSIRSRPPRVASPAFELNLPRAGISHERQRTSLVLPRAVSTNRQPSPGRGSMVPVSPLRVIKPRLPTGGLESSRSPIMSPILSGSEFCSPTVTAQALPNHRRQSSANSSELPRAAVSPRLSMSNNPQPRMLPPSIKDFEIIKPISKGAFGSVYLAKKKSTGDYFAIKALKKADMVAKNQVANVKAERAILMWQGESDFVAKLYWTFPSKDYIFLVMEYLNGGDCASLLRALGTLPEEWAKRYMAEVILGVEHLHSREIVHRDLKPDNLLIDQKGHLKLTDFGLSRMGLIGRQKRALKSKSTRLMPDPLKQGPFHRSISIASSRSASFDVQANTPGNTPSMTPMLYGDSNQPSYFNLSREISVSKELTRQSSGQQSDPGDNDQLQAAFRRFSLYDDPWSISSRQSPKGEEAWTEDESPKGYGHEHNISNSNHFKIRTPPQTTGMLPPPLALFDPDDTNRRFVGTPDYLAPETINGLGQDETSDWWSLGCILFEFLFGYPPYHASTPEQVFEKILTRKIDWPEQNDDEVTVEAKDLINRLMCVDPSNRLGANAGDKFSSGGEEIRKHPWFADLDWDNLNESQPSFVPMLENPEDTEYFDARGATTQDFSTEFDDQASTPAITSGEDYPDRPHDALLKVRTQVNSIKKGLMPLHIPAHVRDGRSRRLSEPLGADDFGQFSFKNLPVLERANKDVIRKLRAEAMHTQNRSTQAALPVSSAFPLPALEGSPTIGIPLKRTSSINQSSKRSGSPSLLSNFNSSPSRPSQPSSPLVQFSAGPKHERRKTSSGSSSVSQAGGSLQMGILSDIPALPLNFKSGSIASSPIKISKSAVSGEHSLNVRRLSNASAGSPRTRSHTVGSNDSETVRARVPHHQGKRSQVLDVSPSSSDNDDTRQKALLRVQRRRQSSRRLSQISLGDGPIFRPLDVLVCEDHPVSRLVMEKLLEKLRCRTIIVQNGAEAIRYATSSVKFDIIMMEFKLPQINGADVARMVRETKNANCHTPLVAVTGYLKELQAPHHFDALVEKPPTMSKLTEVMSKLCQWRPPPPAWASSHVPPMAPSGLRKESTHTEDSPVSADSSFVPAHSSEYPGSISQDSVSSASFFTDLDARSDDMSFAGHKHADHEWHDIEFDGLGISNSIHLERSTRGVLNHMPSLQHADSSPARLGSKVVRKSTSAELIETKRKTFVQEHAEAGESGDDEDEELGQNRSRSKSPRSTATNMKPASKLSTEMFRMDSSDNIVSLQETAVVDHFPAALFMPPNATDATAKEHQHNLLVPPVIFPRRPGDMVKVINMDAEGTFTLQSPPIASDPSLNLSITTSQDNLTVESAPNG